MRKIKYEDLKREKKERFRELIDLENRFEGRVAGNRPRDPEKEKVLIKLDKARMKRYIESGKLEILRPYYSPQTETASSNAVSESYHE